MILDKYLSSPIGLRNIFYCKSRKNYVSTSLDLEINDLYREILLHEKFSFKSDKITSVNEKICEIYKFIKKILKVMKLIGPKMLS